MTKKRKEPSAMLVIGNPPETIEAASRALVEVLKAATQEGAQVAAANALAKIAEAPSNAMISNCTFTGSK